MHLGFLFYNTVFDYTPVTISLRWVCDGLLDIFDRGPTGLLADDEST